MLNYCISESRTSQCECH